MEYLNKEDCCIRRDHPNHPNKVVLSDPVFGILYIFSQGYTDEMICEALNFANKAFDRGVDVGDSYRCTEIKQALGIEGE